MSQADKVIAHVEKWGSINSIQAIQLYGITRLARVIHDLKGTDKAMKGVKDPNSAPGFVKYIPDYTAREKLLCDRLKTVLDHPVMHAGVKAHACLEVANQLTAIELERRG